MTDRNKSNDGGRGGEGDSGHRTLEEGVASKILRETEMVGRGVGGAFLDTAKNPIEKAPEVAMAAGFGVGLKTLQNAGAKGRAVASVVGLGMAGKMAYDEYMGDRWSTFGSALKDNWQSPENFERNLIATKRSVGALAVDSTVATLGFKAAGSQVGNRLLKGEMGSKVPLRVVFDEPHYSWPKSAEGLLASTPRNPALLAGIREAAKGKPIGDHVTPSGLHVAGDFNFPSPMNVSAEGLLAFSQRSELLLKDTWHAARNKPLGDHAGPHGVQDVVPPRKPASLKETGAGERLPKFEEPATKPLESHSGNSVAPGNVEVPASNLSSLNRFSLEMYQGIRRRIEATSGTEHAGLVGGRAHGGHSSSSFLKTQESSLIAGIRASGERISKAEAPESTVRPMEAPPGKSATNPMETSSDGLASLNRFSDEIYDGLNNFMKSKEPGLGTPSTDAAVGGLPGSRWSPPSDTVSMFSTHLTVPKPLQGADAVVSLTSQGTVGSVSLSTSLLSAPGGASKIQTMLGFAELAATDPAACDAATASTLLGRAGLAGRATNTKAALKGAEAYVNGVKGNSYTSFLLDRYGKL